MTSKTSRISITLDIENILNSISSTKLFDLALNSIITSARKEGIIAKIFSSGDLESCLPNERDRNLVRKALQNYNVEHKDIPYSGKKNSADIELAITTVALPYENPTIDHYIIASGDRDFMPVVMKLKERGKIVTGIGASPIHVNPHYAQAFDSFSYLNVLMGYTSPGEENDTLSLNNLEGRREEYCQLLKEAVVAKADYGKKCVSETVLKTIKQLSPDFNLSLVGLGSLKELATLAENKGLVRVTETPSDFLIEAVESQEKDTKISAILSNGDKFDFYKKTIEEKIKCELPGYELRAILFKSIKACAKKAFLPVSLRDFCGDVFNHMHEIENVSVEQKVVFKILLTLFKARCFRTEPFEAYNPSIVDFKNDVDYERNLVYTLINLIRFENRKEAMDSAALSRVFYKTDCNEDYIKELLDT